MTPMTKPTRVVVLGAAGKMGRAIIRTLVETKGTLLAAAVESAGNPAMGRDAGELAGAGTLDVKIDAGLAAAKKADVWIDFTTPAATVSSTPAAAAAGVPLVVGTTGLGAADKQVINTAARKVPVVFAPNMSVGVTMLLKLVADAARALGSSFDLEIVETHHRLKRDAPSGTALRIAQVLAETTGRDLGQHARFSRHGEIGPRTAEEIGVQTVRGGDVVGDHTVFFLGPGERIEITHRASSRETFALGAVRAALWVVGKPPGLYDMRDVLGITSGAA